MRDPAEFLYILDDENRPVRANDVLEWGRFFEGTRRRQAALWEHGPVSVSTVFIGVVMGLADPPLLFETAVFRDGECDIVGRWPTWARAQEGHDETVARVRGEA